MADERTLVDLMDEQSKADDTLRHNEVRRQARRLFDLECRFENVIATIDVQQDELRKLIESREVDRDQIEKLIASNAVLTGELKVIRTEQAEIRNQLASFAESLGDLLS